MVLESKSNLSSSLSEPNEDEDTHSFSSFESQLRDLSSVFPLFLASYFISVIFFAVIGVLLGSRAHQAIATQTKLVLDG